MILNTTKVLTSESAIEPTLPVGVLLSPCLVLALDEAAPLVQGRLVGGVMAVAFAECVLLVKESSYWLKSLSGLPDAKEGRL